MCSRIGILILILSIISSTNARSFKNEQSKKFELPSSFFPKAEITEEDIETTKSHVSRIINGNPASPAVVRHLANLIIIGKREGLKDQVSSCTATVISRRWLLTAAHCFFLPGGLRGSLEDSYAFIAEANATLRSNNTNIRPYKFRKYLTHRKFDPKEIGSGNDMALVQLDRRIEGSKFSKVHLSNQYSDNLVPGTIVRAAGYGLIRIPSSLSDLDIFAKRLNVAPVILESFETCKSRDLSQLKDVLNEKKLLCAVSGESSNGPTNICFGDSGGPLFVQKPGKPILQIAITSFSTIIDCADPNSISWFTRISSFRKDIRQGLRGNNMSWNVVSQ